MPLAWPSVLVPSSEQWGLQNPSRSGGQSFSGVEQIVRSPASRWTGTLIVPCNRREKVLAMRALLAGLDGRAGTALVGPMEVSRAPWFVDPLTGGKITRCRGDRDAAKDLNWDLNRDTSADLDFRLSSPAGMNATEITVQRNRGGLLSPGMFFSIGDRLHMVTELNTDDPTGDTGFAVPGAIKLQIRPWLRADYAAGTPVEFGRPKGLMRLASDDTGAMDLALSRFGTVTVELTEAF